MTDLDLEKLGEQWRQQPSAAELEELRRAASAARGRARWAQVVELGAAVIVAGVVLLLVVTNPRLDTGLVGGAAILVLLTSQARQRKLQRVELRSLSGGTEEMLDQSVARVEATLKRARFSLVGLLPALLLGLGFAHVVQRRAADDLLPQAISDPSLRYLVIGIAVLAIVTGALLLLRKVRSARKELERLILLRNSYRDERESSSVD